MKLDPRIERLIELAHKNHYSCDGDWFYNCPKSPEGSCRESDGECSCGADEHNAEVDKIAKELRKVI